MDKSSKLFSLLAGIATLVASSLFAQGNIIHNGESIDNLTLSWGRGDPASRIELNTDHRFISEGSGSICASSMVSPDALKTSYVGFRFAISPTRLDKKALTFEIWSTQPGSPMALYIRGLNAAGKIVAGWGGWKTDVASGGATYKLSPGKAFGRLVWEEKKIEAPADKIVFIEMIAGCTQKGEPYNFYVDNIRFEPVSDSVDSAVENIGNHGVVAPVGMSTWGHSTIATVDADGGRLVFTKLWAGSTASYLFTDADTGETEQIYPEGGGWGAYDVLMTPDNIIYDTMGNYLVAIDVVSRNVRKLGEFPSGACLGGYARAEDGTVYAGIWPSATLVSYNPNTDQYINHGPLNDEVWSQYPRPLLIDDAGWIYCGIGLEAGQIIGYDPVTSNKVALIPQEKRKFGAPSLFRGTDGLIYANAEEWGLHRLSAGAAVPVDEAPPAAARDEWNTFSDGSEITDVNIPDRKMCIKDAGADKSRELRFDYKSPGVNIYTLISGPDGKIHGATGIPMRIWNFDPATGSIWNSGLGGYMGHLNQFVRQGDVLYGALYSTGELLKYDPCKPFDDVDRELSQNPVRVHYSAEAITLYGRPHAVLAHPDGRHILVGGNAARVLRGSGMLIYDSETGEGTMLDRSALMPDQGINAMVALPDGDVLVGTTIHPPTAGSDGPSKTAVIYRFDMQTKSISATWPLQPDTPAVRDMIFANDGNVYGLAEPDRLFVFDPVKNEFIYDQPLTGYGDAAGYQAPRCMINGPDGAIYALFKNAVVRIEPVTFAHKAIARTSKTITAGIAIEGDRLYFASGPGLYSCSLKENVGGITARH